MEHSKNDDDNPRELLEALSDYQNDLLRGNYNTLEHYKTEWTEKEELAVIYESILDAALDLNLSIEELDDLQAQIKKDLPIPFPQIANLRATLHIKMNQRYVGPTDELDQFQTSRRMVEVEAAMPGPCLAYLGVLRLSSTSDMVKRFSIEHVIYRVKLTRDVFGVLSDAVLRVAIQDWMDLYEKEEPEVKERLSKQLGEHKTQLENCLDIPQIKEKLTVVDKYTLLALEKLNNGIGETPLKE